MEEPPKYLQTECPVCLHILRDPHQVTCCGKSFCKECIGQATSGKRQCPCCNQDSYHVYSNKGLQQPLYQFKVHCSNKKTGCKWTGELGELDKHLNLNVGNELKGCQFAKIECSYCSTVILRKRLVLHKAEICSKRPITCSFCRIYKSTFEDVTNNHYRTCGYYPVKCPNECGASPIRRNIDDHVTRECPLTMTECDFANIGCEVKLPRREMARHLEQNLTSHFSLLAVSHKKQQVILNQQQDQVKMLKEKCCELTTQNEMYQLDITALNQDIIKLRTHLKLNCPTANVTFPVSYIVHTAKRHRELNPWTSPHFYSDKHGYKMCVRVYSRGGFVLNISICLMKGEFDRQIRWPLRANVNLYSLYVKDAADGNGEVSIKIENGRRVVEDDKVVECGSANVTLRTHNADSFQFKVLNVQLL